MKLTDLFFSIVVFVLASVCMVGAQPVRAQELQVNGTHQNHQQLYKRNIFKKIKNGLKKAIKGVKNGFKKVGKGLKKAANGVKTGWKKSTKFVKNVWQGFKKPFKEAGSYLKKAVKDPGGTLKKLGEVISKPVTTVKNMVKQFKGNGTVAEKIGRGLGMTTLVAGGLAAGPVAGATVGSTTGVVVEGVALTSSVARGSHQLSDYNAPQGNISELEDAPTSKWQSKSMANGTGWQSNSTSSKWQKKESVGSGLKSLLKSIVQAPSNWVKDIKNKSPQNDTISNSTIKSNSTK